MDAHVRMADRLPTLKIRAGEGIDAMSSHDEGWSRRCGAQRRERNRVRSRIACLEASERIIVMIWAMRRRRVVLVHGQAVVVLGMIVVRVDVRVQQRPHMSGRNQGRDEQQRQEAVHDDESTRQRGAGQNAAPPHRRMPGSVLIEFLVPAPR
jgi:hypothetical protein